MVEGNQGQRGDSGLITKEMGVKCLTPQRNTDYNLWLNGRGVEQSGSSSGS